MRPELVAEVGVRPRQRRAHPPRGEVAALARRPRPAVVHVRPARLRGVSARPPGCARRASARRAPATRTGRSARRSRSRRRTRAPRGWGCGRAARAWCWRTWCAPATRSAPWCARGRCAGRSTCSPPRTSAGSSGCSARGWSGSTRAGAPGWASTPDALRAHPRRHPGGARRRAAEPRRADGRPQRPRHGHRHRRTRRRPTSCCWRRRPGSRAGGRTARPTSPPTSCSTTGSPPSPPRERDAALAELARRFRAAYGPSDAGDLQYWSGMPAGDARRAWELAGPPPPAPPDEGPPPPRLLPAFDGVLLGHRDRTPPGAPADAAKLTAGVLDPPDRRRGRPRRGDLAARGRRRGGAAVRRPPAARIACARCGPRRPTWAASWAFPRA